MEFLAEIGYFGPVNLTGCTFYGLLLMVMSVWLAINTKKPKREE